MLKKLFITLGLISVFVLSVSASQIVGDADDRGPYYIDPEDVVIGEIVTITTPEEFAMYGGSPDQEDTLAVVSEVSEVSDVSIDTTVSASVMSPITADDTSGLKAVLLNILGPYEPILFEYNYGTNYNTGREVFEDQIWLCSFWMLALLVFCLFRLLGGWLSRKQ